MFIWNTLLSCYIPLCRIVFCLDWDIGLLERDLSEEHAALCNLNPQIPLILLER